MKTLTLTRVARGPLARSGLYGARSAAIVSLCALCATLPSVAGAYATIAPPPTYPSATGLPDGRVYELVSPANKHGYESGAYTFFGFVIPALGAEYGRADGNAMSFGAHGAASEVNSSGVNQLFVAQRSAAGWRSRSAMPSGENLSEAPGISLLRQAPVWVEFSPDMSHVIFGIRGKDVPAAPEGSFTNLYLAGPDPFVEPVWLARPAGGEVHLTEEGADSVSLLGASPDLSTVYFAYSGLGQLVPGINIEAIKNSKLQWGLYEFRNGVLSYAGLLPDGSYDPKGAPALAVGENEAGHYSPAATGNQVSMDGSRVFFTSGGELYVHETDPDGTQRTLLVSKSQLPGHVGEPAPNGVGRLTATPPGPRKGGEDLSIENYHVVHPMSGYASPDGSHVFFKSSDRLTGEAPEGGGLYDFAVDTGMLEYVAAHVAGIVTVVADGSSFVFENSTTSPVELDRWSAGPHGGSVTPIAQLPGRHLCEELSCVGPARLVANNNVLVFSAEAPIAGFNDAGGWMQVFRYDFTSNELGCVSCPPAGVAPTKDAVLSQQDNTFGVGGRVTLASEPDVPTDTRGISADGSRIFFDTADPLVPQDNNGQRDVYEWQNGRIFLISSGSGKDPSLFLDNSESGGDVFIATTSELVPGDNDFAFDVYDARIPRPGDNPPPAAVPCQGDVCQGPPSVPSLLGSPASATFNGLGNPTPEPAAAPAVKPKAKVNRCRKGFVRNKSHCTRKAPKRLHAHSKRRRK